MRCDVIAEYVFLLLPPAPSPNNRLISSLRRGIIKATKELDMTIPLIVRLQGTKEAEAKKSVSPSPFIVPS